MHSSWIAFLSVGLGGAAGAIARYAVTILLQRSAGSIPLGTLASNLVGCLLMGMLARLAITTEWFNAAGLFPDHYRLIFAVGFCGSFTTLSALVFESSELLGGGHTAAMGAYLLASIIGGFLCFYLGFLLVRA